MGSTSSNKFKPDANQCQMFASSKKPNTFRNIQQQYQEINNDDIIKKFIHPQANGKQPSANKMIPSKFSHHNPADGTPERQQEAKPSNEREGIGSGKKDIQINLKQNIQINLNLQQYKQQQQLLQL